MYIVISCPNGQINIYSVIIVDKNIYQEKTVKVKKEYYTLKIIFNDCNEKMNENDDENNGINPCMIYFVNWGHNETIHYHSDNKKLRFYTGSLFFLKRTYTHTENL